jgi:hypothetical protein
MQEDYRCDLVRGHSIILVTLPKGTLTDCRGAGISGIAAAVSVYPPG